MDVLGDILPSTTTFVQILLFQGRQLEWASWILLHDPLVYNLLGASILDGEVVRPLTVNGVERLLFTLTGLEKVCSEGVLLSAEPALTGEVNLRGIAAAADDLGGLF